MQVGLLVPAALALGLLVVGPLLAHLLQRRPVREQLYGAMILLRRLPRKTRRRSRLHDLLLLLLRCLVLLLVAAAVSRPELRWPGAADAETGPRAVVMVVDNSLSMDLRDSGVGLPGAALTEPASALARARAAALEAVRALPEGTRVGVVSIGGAATRLTAGVEADHLVSLAAIDAIPQTSGGTDLVGGLREARRMLEGKGGAVYVFTDQAGPTALPAARGEIELLADQDVALVPRPITPARIANVAVIGARYGDGVEGGSVRLQVMNFGGSPLEVPLTVHLPDGKGITTFVDLPAEGMSEATVTIPRVAEGGVAVAEVEDPALPADNRFSFHLPRVGASRVLVVDGDPGSTPVASEVYFLERALSPWGGAGGVAAGVLPDVTTIAGLSNLDPEVHRVVFLANVADPEPVAARLGDFVRKGGALVVGLGNNVTGERYNGALGPLLPAGLKAPHPLGALGDEGLPMDLPDAQTELFRPFARGGLESFGRARFRQVYDLEPYEEATGTRTLMRLQGGVPLLVEHAFGRGKVLLYTSTFDLGWCSFPFQAAFVPWVQRLVSYLGAEAGGGGERRTATVGDNLGIKVGDATAEATVQGPSGPRPSQLVGDELRFLVDAPGDWRVLSAAGPPIAWVAVNVDPRESDVRPGPSLVETAAEIDPERFLRRAELAPWLLAAALGVAVAQALVGAWLTRRSLAEPDREVVDAAQ